MKNTNTCYPPRSIICAGYSRRENTTCLGDPGGPLTVDNKLVGVANSGENGCPGYQPGDYASVSYHWKWIKNTMETYA